MLQFHISDFRIAFDADFPITAGDSWMRFADCSPVPPDFTYRCFLSPRLPELPENSCTRRYFDSVKGSFYAITREVSHCEMQLFLSEENLPWGLTVDQIFTQLAITHVLLKKSRLLLHAAYILTEQGAILFTAPSGTGKSTQAQLWETHKNARIINGDRAVAGLKNGVPTAYGFPLSGSSPCCLNRSAPLRAIVSLKQAPHNSVRILRGMQAVSVLMNGTALPPEYQDDLPKTVDAAIGLAERAPILELSCRPDTDAVLVLENALMQIENGGAE